MESNAILYSFRRCPYAMRARMALAYAGTGVELREVLLKDKPAAMLEASPKGTVPVLVLPGDKVIDESIDIMAWALDHADPDGWRSDPVGGTVAAWLAANDGDFKAALDRYKYADRHPEQPPEYYRSQGEVFLQRLERVLAREDWLHGAAMGSVDVALFPFVRQFAMVDRGWFAQSPYAATRRWLDTLLEHPLFLRVMVKYLPWTPGATPVRFPPPPGPGPGARP